MATITSLKFDITSAWDPAGMRAAQEDIRRFRDELRAMSKDGIKVRVELDDAEAQAKIRELTDKRHQMTVVTKAETTEAKEQIDAASRDRESTIVVHTRSDGGGDVVSELKKTDAQIEAEKTRSAQAQARIEAIRQQAAARVEATRQQAAQRAENDRAKAEQSVQSSSARMDAIRQTAERREAESQARIESARQVAEARAAAINQRSEQSEEQHAAKLAATWQKTEDARNAAEQRAQVVANNAARRTEADRQKALAAAVQESRRIEAAALAKANREAADARSAARSTQSLTNGQELHASRLTRSGIQTAHAQSRLEQQQRHAEIRAQVDDTSLAIAKAKLDAVAKTRTAKIKTADPKGKGDIGKPLTELIGIKVDTKEAESGLSSIGDVAGKVVQKIALIGTALTALGPIATATGAILTGVLGAGVIGAGIAAIEVNKKLAESHLEAQRAAQQQADTAQKNLTDAYRTVAEAATDGAQKIQVAEHNVTTATRDEEDARRNLTEAYRDARHELEDLQMQLEAAPVNERAAQLQLERARQRLAQLGMNGQPVTPLDFSEAQNDIQEAQVHLDEVTEKNKQLQEDAAVAAQKGVEDNDKVRSAKEGVVDATYKQQQSEIELARTQRDAADANQKAAEDLKVALDQVATSQSALSKATREANSVTSQMAAMFADLATPLQGPLHDALEAFKSQVTAMAPTIRDTFSEAATLVMPFENVLSRVALNAIPGVNVALGNMRPVVDGMADGLGNLSTGVGQMFADMSKGAQGLGDAWRYWGTTFAEFLDIWGQFIGNIAGDGAKSLDMLFQGINNLASGLLNGLEPVIHDTAGGASILYEVFSGLGQILEVIGSPLGQLIQAMSAQLAPAIHELAGPLGQLLAQMLLALIPLVPLLTDFVKAITAVIQAVTPFASILGPAFLILWQIDPIMKIAGAGIKGLSLAFDGVGGAIKGVGWAIGGMFDVIKGLPGAIGGVFTAIKSLPGAIGGIMATLASPWTLVAIAVAGIVLGIGYLISQTKAFQNLWNSMPKSLTQLGTQVGNFFTQKDQNGQTGAARTGQTVMNAGKTVGSATVDVAKDIGADAVKVFNAIKGPAEALWAFFEPAIAKIGQGLVGAFENLKSAWDKDLSPALKDLGNNLLQLWDKIKPAVEVVGAIILGVLKAVLEFIGMALPYAAKAIGDILTGVVHIVSGIIEVISGIVDYVRGVIGIIEGLYEVFKGVLTLNPGEIMKGLRDIVGGFTEGFHGIIEMGAGFGRAVGALFMTLVRAVADIWSGFWDNLGKYASDFWHGLLKDLDSNWTDLEKNFSDAISSVSSGWNSFLDGLGSAAKAAWDAIINGVENFLGPGLTNGLRTLVSDAGNILDGLRDAFATPLNVVIGLWDDTAGKIGLPTIPKLEGRANGGQPGSGMYRGAGGSRDDKNVIAISDREYIVNANATAKNRGLLDAINFGGHVPTAYTDGDGSRYAIGGMVRRHVIGFQGGGAIDWMTQQASKVAPGLVMTSGFRAGDSGYHGQGKAADFSNSNGPDTPEMESFANWIASTWGSKTLELIHSGGFGHNIKDGRDVGDGVGVYGAGSMAQHVNHVHWAVNGPLDGNSGSGGILGMIGNVIGDVVSGARSLLSNAFQTATDPIVNSIPDPIPGLGKPVGSTAKALATFGRDQMLNAIRGKESPGSSANAPFGANVIPSPEHKAIIDEALRITSTPPPETLAIWEAGMETLVGRESTWNSAAINMGDSNAAAGTPSKGLAQVIDPTFQAYKAPGHDNIWEPVDNLAASINYIKARYSTIMNVQQANANMPPKGYANGTDNAAPGWAWVGEKGPELVKFAGGETVVPNDLTQQVQLPQAPNDLTATGSGPTPVTSSQNSTPTPPSTQNLMPGATITTNPSPQEVLGSAWSSVGGTNKLKAMGLNFLGANLTEFAQDFTGTSFGDGALPQIVTQGINYGNSLQAYWKNQAATNAAPYNNLSNQIGGDLAQPNQGAPPGATVMPTQPVQANDTAQPYNGPAEVHFHTTDVQGALKQWNQQQRERAMGFDPYGGV